MLTLNTTADKKSSTVFTVVIVLVCLLFAILSSLTGVRQMLSSRKSERTVLAKVFAKYDQKVFVIIKIKTESGLDVEVFEKDPEGHQQKLKQKFSLNDDNDAYLMVRNDSINLGLFDVNKDGQLDIICPSVDRLGNSRLNIFEDSKELHQFIPLIDQSPDSIN